MEKKEEDKYEKARKKTEKILDTSADTYDAVGKATTKIIVGAGKLITRIGTGVARTTNEIKNKGIEKVADETFKKATQKSKDLGQKIKDSFKDEETAKNTIYKGIDRIVDGTAKAVKYTVKKVNEFMGEQYASLDDLTVKLGDKEYVIGRSSNELLKMAKVTGCKTYIVNIEEIFNKYEKAKEEKDKSSKGMKKSELKMRDNILLNIITSASTNKEELIDYLTKWKNDDKNIDPTKTVKEIEVVKKYL